METFAELLAHRSAASPDVEAFTFLEDGEVAATLTFAELDRQASRIAGVLAGAQGERALLLFPPGLDFVSAFFGCLRAGVVAVPAYPPDPAQLERTLPRLRAIARDCGASFALSLAEVCSMGEALLPGPRWIATDTLGLSEGRISPRNPGHVAFLQYTSGSTQAPRGVRITHDNLRDNATVIVTRAGLGSDATLVSWLPAHHDMGLMNGVLLPIQTGARAVLMSPTDFIRRPVRWLQAMTRWQAVHSGGPNFAYELCLRRVGPEARAELDLSSWRNAFNGAEPVRASTLERFGEVFGPCGFRTSSFRPAYGLAENTVYVSSGTGEPEIFLADPGALERGSAEPAVKGTRASALVGLGHVPPHWKLRIVDPDEFTPCEPGQVGEIWLQGPSVGDGYWGGVTGGVFAARLASDPDAGPHLRTGDLGFLRDGSLFVAGRLKDVIVLRGACHHPADLEVTVEASHAGIRHGCVAAFALQSEGVEVLGIVAELRPDTANPGEVLNAVQDGIAANHGLFAHTVALVEPGAVPKTSSGKVQRSACRIDLSQGRLAITAHTGGLG